MDHGFKQARVIDNEAAGSTPSQEPRSGDTLFDKEWDELVIRFDSENSRYLVRTSVLPADNNNSPLRRQERAAETSN